MQPRAHQPQLKAFSHKKQELFPHVPWRVSAKAPAFYGECAMVRGYEGFGRLRGLWSGS